MIERARGQPLVWRALFALLLAMFAITAELRDAGFCASASTVASY